MNAPSQAVQPENRIKKTKPVLKSPMQLNISLQRSKYNMKNNEYCKNQTKIALPDRYYMYLSDIDSEVIYILVSIKLHIGNDMDKGHYVCDVLDYNIGTWRNCYDEEITQYSGYPMNVYNDLSSDKRQKNENNRYVWII